MNKLLFGLWLALIPLLLTSRTFTPDNYPLAHHFLPHQAFMNQPGRGWRLHTLTNSHPLLENQWETEDSTVVYYNNFSYDTPDSLTDYAYDWSLGEWVVDSRYYLTYDPSHEFIEQILIFHDYNDGKISYQYDQLHRLTRVVAESRDTTTSPWTTDYRYYFIFTSDNEFDMMVRMSNGSFTKYDYEHDTMGRIIQNNMFLSSDSLHWFLLARSVLNYHPNDTTTGADVVYNYAHYYPLNYAFLEASGFSLGLLNEEIYQYLEGSSWINSFRTLYTYYNNGNLICEQMEQWSDSEEWEPDSRYSYSYDNNGNLLAIIYEIWGGNLWDSDNLKSFTWEQFTSSEDENNGVTPPPNVIQVFPNPFYTEATIKSSLNQPAEIFIYNLKGQFIRKLDAEKGSPAIWNGIDNSGKDTAAGIYLIRIKSGNQNLCSKVLHIK